MNRSWKLQNAILLFLLVCAGAGTSAPDPEPNFPGSTPEAQGMDSAQIVKMIRYILDNSKDVHNIVIVRNGYVVTNAAFFPNRSDAKHIVNSCTKSVTSALVGIAVSEGLIKSVNDPVLGYFRDRNIDASDARKKALTLRNLLMMSDGMDWTEDGNYGGPRDSWGLMWDSPNQVDYVLSLPMREEPGRRFYYNTGASHLLSAMVQNASGKTAYDFAKEKLFTPLGIEDTFWSSDNNGVTVGGAGLFLRPQDLAKFGLLYLRKGKWKDRQILPAKWVEESTSRLIETPMGLAGRHGYGYQWWMNGFGGYSARGYRGQYLFVVPKLDLAVVFTCGLPDSDFFLPEMLMESFIISAVKSGTALKPNPEMTDELDLVLKQISSPPAPSPTTPLPETARRITGQTFVGVESSSLEFVFDKPDECRMTISENSGRFTLDIGLDSVYRISDIGTIGIFPDHNLSASRGRWLGDDTFIFYSRMLGDDDELEYRCRFENDGLSYRVSSRLSVGIWEDAFYKMKRE
jgi:CubicO group peptidase (beta-lactamase class C family)